MSNSEGDRDGAAPCGSHTGGNGTVAPEKKGVCLFQQNKVRTGLNVGTSSRPSTSFGSHLLLNIDKQPPVSKPLPSEKPRPDLTQPQRSASSTVSKGASPAKGFFCVDVDHHSSSSSQGSLDLVAGSQSSQLNIEPQHQHKTGVFANQPMQQQRNAKWPKARKSRSEGPYHHLFRGRGEERKRSSSALPRLRKTVSDHGCTKYIERIFTFPNGLTSSIFSSHPKYSKEVTSLGTLFRIEVRKHELENEQLTLMLKGHPVGVSKAESKLNELVSCVQEGISSEVVAPMVRCTLVPVLWTQQMQSAIEEIEKKNRVKILICTTRNTELPVTSNEFACHPSSAGSDLQTVTDLKDFLIPLGPVNIKYKWQAQNDQEFQELPADVQDSINQCSFNGLPQFSREGKQYQIDFVEELLCEVSTGIVRKLIKQAIPPSWSYKMGKQLGFMDFEPQESEVIENLLHYGGSGVKLLHFEKGTIDFDNLILLDLGSKFDTSSVDLKRKPPLVELPTYGVKLAIKGLQDDIKLAKYSLKEKIGELENVLISQSIPLPSVSEEQQHKIRAQIVNNARQYFVDVSVGDDNDKATIVLIGEQRYVQSVYVQIQKDAIELQQHLLSQDRIHVHSRQYFEAASARPKYPTEWSPPKSLDSCETLVVVKQSIEWNSILDLMRKTMPNVNVVQIERIQNVPLWDKFALEMTQMGKRNGDSGINEKLLFHGTSKTDPRRIIESVRGIDFRYSNQDRSLLWGKGAYFAVNASYSNNYSYRIGSNKQMLLVRILTGRSFSYGRSHDTKLTKPPPLQPGSDSHQLYDTVNGHTHGSDVYVVYDHDRAYPAYLITYK